MLCRHNRYVNECTCLNAGNPTFLLATSYIWLFAWSSFALPVDLRLIGSLRIAQASNLVTGSDQPCYPMDTCQFCQYLSGGATHSLFALRCCVLWHRSPFASPWPQPAQQRLSLRLRSGHGRKWPKSFPARRKEVARRSRFRRQGNEPAS